MKNKLFHIGIQSVVFFTLFTGHVFAQNLVKNPSFEDFDHCPQTFGSLEDDVLFWRQPTLGSTDYFHNCSTKMPASKNFIGFQEPFDGDAYVGFYAYAPKDYREYITGQLKTKLVKGKTYVFSVRLSLSDMSAYAVAQFGALFTHKPLQLSIKSNIPILERTERKSFNFISLKHESYYNDEENWIEATGVFTAKGTEKYLVFGNFKNNVDTNKITIQNDLRKVAYYYVDMVSLEEIDKPFKLEKIYVFKNLLFDFDDHSIMFKDRKQLKSLLSYLKANPLLNISIYGHTDSLGSPTYNLNLSKKRAKAVSKYLVAHGLSPERIVWKGFGYENPVAKNDTETGRDKNRRVEFIISKNKEANYASSLFDDGN